MYLLFFYVGSNMCNYLGRRGSRIHCENKASLWRWREAQSNVLLRSIEVGVSFKHNPLLKPGNGIPWLKGPIFNRKIHPATLQKWFKNGLRDKTKISAWFLTPHFPYLNLIKNLIKKEYIAAKILLWQDIIRGVVEAIRERVFCSHKRELNNIREWVWCSCLSL